MATEKTEEKKSPEERRATREEKKEAKVRARLPEELVDKDVAALKVQLKKAIGEFEALKEQMVEKKSRSNAIREALAVIDEPCDHENVTKQGKKRYKCDDCGEVMKFFGG